MSAEKKKETGYSKYINWKIFIIPVISLFSILAMPPTSGMKDVGTEYALGAEVSIKYLSKQLFDKAPEELEQWQLLTARIIEKNTRTGAFKKDKFLKRDLKWCKKNGIPADKINLEKAIKFIEAYDETAYFELAKSAFKLKTDELNYNNLSESEKKTADKGIWKLKVSLAVMVFVVICFLTECIPLPAVAFCVGLIFVFTGVVSREDVAALYWSDACWFIMGSLMFAAAFVKTGVDRRICLLLFNKLAKPSVAIITLVLILVISPAAAFISDHALAAIFLPIAIILYRGSQGTHSAPDLELGKMLVLTIAMACNIGGFGAPSGGARNVIMIQYLHDMFGMDIGYFQWVTYGMPFVIIMMPLTWLLIQLRFKPKIRDLTPAMEYLKEDIARMGKWNRQQIVTLVIFLTMLFFWFTEQTFYEKGIIPVRLGIGVIALAGGVAYILAGIVNWRDYQEKVDWGVVWLYAGAIIFGKMLDESGAAYYLARTMVEKMATIGLGTGTPLLVAGNIITSLMTQLMADGPCAAAVGPITLNIAGIAHPGTVMLPFMAMSTACASSFAYCLIIGTPPNAIVYASGVLEPKDFLRVGVPLWVIANIVLFLLIKFYWIFRGFAGLPGF